MAFISNAVNPYTITGLYHMMTAAGDGVLRGLFEGCISCRDMSIQQRPYHKNCGCALHSSRGHCPHMSRYNNVSYPVRRSWSEGCLSLMASSGQYSPCSSASSPTVAAASEELKRVKTQLLLCDEQD